MNCPKPQTRRGFTLIELVVIIVLIAIIAGIAIPSYARFWDKTRFNGAVRDIVDIIADARERAIAKDSTVSLSFDTRSQTFVLEVTPPPPPAEMPAAMLNGAESDILAKYSSGGLRGYQLREDIAVTEFSVGGGLAANTGRISSESLRFQGDGTSEGARLIIGNQKGYAATITVLPSTGQILVEEL